ncbi:hypothetical protein P879_09581 [Paragonimus westermani]|uniref:EF-hand domain-containing protein n=1 Tax=Paragonimus westermani TaxID=34504 RepID=A0A8T0D7Q2_9TREM|nr:hypothetical protein P879_09581 [Paragonimus westermani]
MNSYVAPQQSHLLTLFRKADKDGNGQIDVYELQDALSNGINIPFNIKTVHMLLAMFDRDFSGRIEFHEFSDLYTYITQWKQCFERFDTDRSGTIDSRELHTALATFGYRLSPSFINQMISRFDRTHRGVIAFDDFIQALVCLQQLTKAFRPYDVQGIGYATMNFEQFLAAAFTAI